MHLSQVETSSPVGVRAAPPCWSAPWGQVLRPWVSALSFQVRGPVSAWRLVNRVPTSSWSLASSLARWKVTLNCSQTPKGPLGIFSGSRRGNGRSVVPAEKLGSSLSSGTQCLTQSGGVGGRERSLNPDCPSETLHCSSVSGLHTQWFRGGGMGGQRGGTQLGVKGSLGAPAEAELCVAGHG